MQLGKDDTVSQHVPLAALSELVLQYQHRLMSLEAELQDRARSGALTEAAYTKRMVQLQELHADLRTLQEWATAEAEGEVSAGDIGLPLLGTCTPAEARVCAQYLKDKAVDLAGLLQVTAQVERWLRQALSGQVGMIRQILRLSKLRQMIVAAERRSERLRGREQELAAHVESLFSHFKGGRSRDLGISTLAALKTLFLQVDATIARIARLKVSVQREESRTQAMTAWLAKERREREAARPPMAPPTPLMIARAVSMTRGDELTPTLPRQRQRRSLAEQYWLDLTGPGRTGPVAEAIRHAAALMGGRRP